MDNKQFSLKLKSGKEQSFANGEEMYSWYIKETGTRKTNKKKTKDDKKSDNKQGE